MHLLFTGVSKVTRNALRLRNQLKNPSSKQLLILKSKRLFKHISVQRCHVNEPYKTCKRQWKRHSFMLFWAWIRLHLSCLSPWSRFEYRHTGTSLRFPSAFPLRQGLCLPFAIQQFWSGIVQFEMIQFSVQNKVKLLCMETFHLFKVLDT